MVKRLFKHEAGAATQFISRRRARKKLQLSLADFRRLCILKGVYPHEPKNKKKVNKGSTAPRTFYFAKDINFLAHEPLIEKFRAHKAIIKKLKRHTGRKDYVQANKTRNTLEDYNVDHIVLERYPNFTDALRDLDDALSLVCLFATFPQSRKVHTSTIQLCERLRNEWMHFVIESKSVKKAFISIKGIYIQANVLGENITWVLPHSRAFTPPSDVDFRVMSTFAEFYTSLIGFTLFQLYKREDLVYPPQCKIETEEELGKEGMNQEKLNAMIHSLVRSGEKGVESKLDSEDNLDNQKLEENVEEENADSKKIEAEEEAQRTLFSKAVFYFNREVPSDVMIVLVRSLGGRVVLNEDDSEITHQIVDKTESLGLDMKHSAKRSYLQPQWIFDCINACILMPVSRYLPGADLPAHLSPFVKHDGSYKPPERLEIEALQRGEDPGLIYGASAILGEGEEEDEEADAEEPEVTLEEESVDSEAEEEDPKKVETPSKKPQGKRKATKAKVVPGKKDNPGGKHAEDEGEAKRLAKSAMPKKFKRIHDKIEFAKKKDNREVKKLQEKRVKHDSGKAGLKQPEEKKARRMSTRNKK
jgi:pescadillo protein